MAVQELKVESRSASGTKQVRRIREQGYVPAVVYGGEGESVPVQVALADMNRELREHRRVFSVEVAGKKEGVYLHDVQFDCLTDLPMHADFLRIPLDKPLQVEIVLNFTGHPKGLVRGGKVTTEMARIPLSCQPDSLPYEIEVGIGGLDLDDKILAKDVTLPEGVSLNCPEDAVVVQMTL